MEQTKKRSIPEVRIRGSEFTVVVEELPRNGNGSSRASETPAASGPPAAEKPVEQSPGASSVEAETVVKKGRIPQHFWGAGSERLNEVGRV